jgi:hypothetical protein
MNLRLVALTGQQRGEVFDLEWTSEQEPLGGVDVL